MFLFKFGGTFSQIRNSLKIISRFSLVMFKKIKISQVLGIPGKGINHWDFGLLLIIVTSLIYSRFLLTISIAVLFAISLFFYFKKKDPLVAKKDSSWMYFPVIIAILYLLSIFYSENLDQAFESIKVKLLFILIPISLLRLKKISVRQVSIFYHLFIGLVLIGVCWSLIQIPYQKIDLVESYTKGEVIPTVIHHIRFSLLVAFAAVVCILSYFRQRIERILPRISYLIIALFFIGYLHVLAVRSGLVGVYIALFFLVGVTFTNKKKRKVKSICVIIAAILLVSAYKTVPSLQSKIDYTVYSLKIYGSGHQDIGNYSDSRRLVSYEAAIHVIKSHPLVGVGIGDLHDEIQRYYKEKHPEMADTYVHPHNQYLFSAVAIGIFGGLFILFFTVALIWHHFKNKDWLLVSFNLIWLLSFLVEDTLEMQIGVSAYLLFNYLGWRTDLQSEQAVLQPADS